MRVLSIAGMQQARDEMLDTSRLATELDTSVETARSRVEELEACGLLLSGLDEGLPPILREAGRQFLARRGAVPAEVLWFLPQTIDDLHARQALLAGGSTMVDEFRAALLAGRAVDHARGLVPDAFEPAVDERLAIDLFAAAVALMARLSAGEPAGSVAEEILAVELMDRAEVWVDMRRDSGELDDAQGTSAVGELRGLFDLFQDDDVLDLFEMAEPADAALAGHDPINTQMGVVDQRIESWFVPFNWTAPTGYLHDPPGAQ
jgi:hypothetical protein